MDKDTGKKGNSAQSHAASRAPTEWRNWPPERQRGMVGGHHDPPPSVVAGDHQRLVKSRRFVALLPAQPVGRPGRKEERDDPAHRTPPPPTPRPRRREPGPIQ